VYSLPPFGVKAVETRVSVGYCAMSRKLLEKINDAF
jgi:hypothetical protein